MAVVLELSRLRSAHIVGRALAEACPTEDSWIALLNNQSFVEMVDEFAQTVQVLRGLLASLDDVSLEKVEQLTAEHHEKAIAAVEEFAAAIHVPPQDLLAVLVASEGR